LDAYTIKKDFPIFNRSIKVNKPLVYLDSAATSQKPTAVINAMNAFYENSNANIHRGIHTLAEEATFLYEAARERIAHFIGAAEPAEVIYTRNATESINLVAATWGSKNLKSGDLVVLTEMEHHSNLVPWYIAAEKQGFLIEFIKVDDSGLLNMTSFEALLVKEPKLVAFTHMSNVLGTINPAKEMVEKAHQAGAVVLIDGAQAVPHFNVNVTEIDADFYAFSAHKMCGPTGIGVLHGKKEILQEIPPYMGGGEMIKKVTFAGFTANELPHKFEAGTPAIAEAIGFGTAVDYLGSIGMNDIETHEKKVTRYAMDLLSAFDDINLIGPRADKKGGVVSFVMDGVHPHDIAQILDSEGIAVRAGHHCAMPLHERLNIIATTRASFYLYNTKKDVDLLLKGLDKVREIFA
jgi:cysteine desulfurase/selenocysteine lyase